MVFLARTDATCTLDNCAVRLSVMQRLLVAGMGRMANQGR